MSETNQASSSDSSYVFKRRKRKKKFLTSDEIIDELEKLLESSSSKKDKKVSVRRVARDSQNPKKKPLKDYKQVKKKVDQKILSIPKANSRAKNKMPADFILKKSDIPEFGNGIFSKEEVPLGSWFGPYDGLRIPVQAIIKDMDMSYMWEIIEDGEFKRVIDGRDDNFSNWMRHINCARNDAEQNLCAFQYNDNIYYKSNKLILANSELLVWYEKDFIDELGTCIFDSKKNIPTSRHEKFIKIFMETGNGNKEPDDNKGHKKGKSANTNNKERETHALTDKSKKGKESKSPGIKRQYVCEVCQKAFRNLCDIKIHKRRHTGEKPYECLDCGSRFICSGELSQHNRTHTGYRPYKCDECGRCFTFSSGLSSHQLIHTEKTHACEQCDSKFRQLSGLKVHQRIHTGDKPFKCDECGKAFRRRWSLTQHKRQHAGIIPHRCNECGKGFMNSTDLIKHAITHTGLRPFVCEKCENTFTADASLRRHMLIHSGERPHTCSFCEKTFRRKHHLDNHRKRYHTTVGQEVEITQNIAFHSVRL